MVRWSMDDCNRGEHLPESMTTKERQEVRAALITAGFSRITTEMPENPIYYDGKRGAYREVWQHNIDHTLITVDWDYKTDEHT